jgi:hypothetical protein
MGKWGINVVSNSFKLLKIVFLVENKRFFNIVYKVPIPDSAS